MGPEAAQLPDLLEDESLPAELPPTVEMSEPQSVELVFWESIKDSTRMADYEAYLKEYQGGNSSSSRKRASRGPPPGRVTCAIRRTATLNYRFGSPCARATTRPACKLT